MNIHSCGAPGSTGSAFCQKPAANPGHGGIGIADPGKSGGGLAGVELRPEPRRASTTEPLYGDKNTETYAYAYQVRTRHGQLIFVIRDM